MVLSHELWRRRFGGDPAVVGRPVLVDGTPHEVVGVAPEGFTFPIGSQIWAPLAFDPAEPPSRTARYLTVVARLAPGRTLEEAQAQMTVVADRLAREHPKENRDRGARVYTLAQGTMDQGLGPILALWQAAAGFVLLIATLRLPIVEGRGLTAADREDAAPVALVSRALAERYFPARRAAALDPLDALRVE